jgi:predicted  nucleic acid-binding Zn-ribbon protein
MDQLEMLWEYQQADMEADRLENEIRRSPNRVKLVKSRDFLVEQQNTIKQIENEVLVMSDRIDVIRDAILRAEDQLKALTAKLEKEPPQSLEDARQQSFDARKLMDTLNGFEQEMKRIRKDAGDRDHQQHEVRLRAAKVKAEFDQLKAAYDVEYKERMAALEKQRATAAQKAKGIAADLMEKYKTIKLHSVPPMARLLNDQCGGCNMSLPSVVLRSIKAGGTVVECETCGRMIIQ